MLSMDCAIQGWWSASIALAPAPVQVAPRGVCAGRGTAGAAAAAAGRPTDGPASGRAPARTWRHMLDDDPAAEAIELLLVLNL